MTKALAAATRAVSELSADEKFELAGLLLDSADASDAPATEIDAAWDTEIQKRLADVRAGRTKTIPLSETKRRIEKRLAR